MEEKNVDGCGRKEKFSAFKKKDVVNICDGSKLGRVCDIEFDDVSGNIHMIIVSNESGISSLFCKQECYDIPWCKIVRVGDDIILVDVCTEQVSREC